MNEFNKRVVYDGASNLADWFLYSIRNRGPIKTKLYTYNTNVLQVLIGNYAKWYNGVYMLCHKKTSKAYIGSTIRPAKQRINEHYNDLSKNKHHNYKLQAAFNAARGDDPFHLTFLCLISPISLSHEGFIFKRVRDAEQFFIDTYWDNKYGLYNINKDVYGFNCDDANLLNKKTGELSQHKLRRKLSHDFKQIKPEDISPQLREWIKLNGSWCKGLTYDSNESIKIKTDKISKPCLMYDNEGRFIERYRSLSQAARVLNLNTGALSKSCKTGKIINGMRFEYEKNLTP